MLSMFCRKNVAAIVAVGKNAAIKSAAANNFEYF